MTDIHAYITIHPADPAEYRVEIPEIITTVGTCVSPWRHGLWADWLRAHRHEFGTTRRVYIHYRPVAPSLAELIQKGKDG